MGERQSPPAPGTRVNLVPSVTTTSHPAPLGRLGQLLVHTWILLPSMAFVALATFGIIDSFIAGVGVFVMTLSTPISFHTAAKIERRYVDRYRLIRSHHKDHDAGSLSVVSGAELALCDPAEQEPPANVYP